MVQLICFLFEVRNSFQLNKCSLKNNIYFTTEWQYKQKHHFWCTHDTSKHQCIILVQLRGPVSQKTWRWGSFRIWWPNLRLVCGQDPEHVEEWVGSEWGGSGCVFSGLGWWTENLPAVLSLHCAGLKEMIHLKTHFSLVFKLDKNKASPVTGENKKSFLKLTDPAASWEESSSMTPGDLSTSEGEKGLRLTRLEEMVLFRFHVGEQQTSSDWSNCSI